MSTHGELQRFLTEHGVHYFSARELAPRALPPRGLWPNILPTVHIAQLLRRRFGRIGVNSGYRDEEHNWRVGGAPNSLHLAFNALDLRSLERNGPDSREMYEYLRHLAAPTLMGIGVYTGFIHIDTRCLIYGVPFWHKDYRRT